MAATTTERFITKTYNGLSILVDNETGYINASKLAKRHSESKRKHLQRYLNCEDFTEIVDYWRKNELTHFGSTENIDVYYELKNVANEFKGTYIHPDLIHFVAHWVSAEYGFKVKHIMDSINDKVHEVLNEKQIEDKPENAKPIFNEVVKSIVPDIKNDINYNDCWGYRDNAHTLDQWEQDDLRRCIDEYKDIKERLTKAENKINEWGSFVKKYYPEF